MGGTLVMKRLHAVGAVEVLLCGRPLGRPLGRPAAGADDDGPIPCVRGARRSCTQPPRPTSSRAATGPSGTALNRLAGSAMLLCGRFLCCSFLGRLAAGAKAAPLAAPAVLVAGQGTNGS